MYGKYLVSMIITNLPQKSPFAFLLEASAALPCLHWISVSQETEHLSVMLQIVSPLANKLYAVDTTSVQVFRCLWFSSRNCVFLATCQPKRSLGFPRYRAGLMFPLNLLLPFLQEFHSASDIHCWGSHFFNSLGMSAL